VTPNGSGISLFQIGSLAALATVVSSRRRWYSTVRQQTGDVVIWTSG
jgi:cell shape-determining protein MreC